MDVLTVLSKYSGVSEPDILKAAQNSHRLYKTYTAKKRSGGLRLISEPSPTLKHLQRCVVKLFISGFPVSPYCAAYEKGCTVYKNAEKHRAAVHILKTDIKGFFHSVDYNRFFRLLSVKYAESDIRLLWDLCSYCGCLPMGAPSSPAISNRVMYKADMEISRLFKKRAEAGKSLLQILFKRYDKIVYTRYSDDITVSSAERLSKEFVHEIEKILNSHGFLINMEKTRFCGPGERKRVTGVIIENKSLTLGLKFRKDLKKKIYNYITKKQGSEQRIRGLVTYAASVEPEFAASLCAKYPSFF